MENIRAIRTEDDYNWALAEIEQYFDNEPELGTDASERFDILAGLIEAYEAKHWTIEPADPIEAIQYRMETSGFTQNDLAKILGSKSRASEILHRKRPLTMQMAYKLFVEWKIPADALLRPYHLVDHDDNKKKPERKRASSK
jgi:HTH-type transcriptional regulator/antitoxin HigA